MIWGNIIFGNTYMGLNLPKKRFQMRLGLGQSMLFIYPIKPSFPSDVPGPKAQKH